MYKNERMVVLKVLIFIPVINNYYKMKDHTTNRISQSISYI